MSLTPRQIVSYLEFTAEIDRMERADALAIAAIAAQGDSKTIQKTMKDLTG